MQQSFNKVIDIKNKFGKEYVSYIDYAGDALLKNKEIRPSRFSKMSPIKKMFI